MALTNQYREGILEAGLDEAGRGCLAGPVVAAAVILPPDFHSEDLNDSKQLNKKKRESLREVIMQEALTWNVGIISHERIDQINILNASFEAMIEAVEGLSVKPEALLVDGNRFPKYVIPATCMIKGDGRFRNIAAASILAKTFRDDIMQDLAAEFPWYGWKTNKGYPTQEHKLAIRDKGLSPWHRKSFNYTIQTSLFETA